MSRKVNASILRLPSCTRLVFLALRSVSNQTNLPSAAAILKMFIKKPAGRDRPKTRSTAFAHVRSKSLRSFKVSNRRGTRSRARKYKSGPFFRNSFCKLAI